MSQSITVRTPREIVSELDRYIVGQQPAKRAVAIALRNRWRREQIDPRLREEVSPKNIILMGPTGCGKTEIARRLANQDQSPFVKVEATKFTEVGYMGRDVDSMVRDLVECAVKICREQELKQVQQRSQELAQQRLVDLLLPKTSSHEESFDLRDASVETPQVDDQQMQRTRQKVLEMLQAGAFDDREVCVQVMQKQSSPMMHLFAPSAMEDMASNLQDALQSALGPGKKKQRKMKVPEALQTLAQEEAQKLIDMEQVHQKAVTLAEESGILFIDEIDKIASPSEKSRGPDVSREGVQRDILPIVEGCSVSTKYGIVKTDHILFIAAGAFHTSKPSDLIPELQGRFHIRVQLDSLGEEDFRRILVEPESSLIKQYCALLAVEGVHLKFTDDGLAEIAHMAVAANALHENIGARRLYTDRVCVQKRLQPILASEDPCMLTQRDKFPFKQR